jgi:hypothetical protein
LEVLGKLADSCQTISKKLFFSSLAGFVCSIGCAVVLSGGSPYISYIGMILCGLCFISLFFGQRLAKGFLRFVFSFFFISNGFGLRLRWSGCPGSLFSLDVGGNCGLFRK